MTELNARRLARLSAPLRQAFLDSLSEIEAAHLLHEWRFWARPEQQAPATAWETWLVLAGRGFGKTRTGAEWVRAEAESGRRRRIALVGPTLRDVRKTMVEGEAGVVSISPPWFRPLYVKTQQRLVWPNGVVAGLGADGIGYVLADRSGRFRPEEWAGRAISAFRAHRADRIVGEVNNGGDLVEATLRAVDAALPFRAVSASRGKRIRAEPVAALYEQNRVRHVGVLSRLEDQMVGWQPGEDLTSPDRVDALVWALTELMLGEPSFFYVGR